jgi:MbtH protein
MSQIDEKTYRVVVNHEEQYSIWPTDRELPPGWSEVPVSGSKGRCLEYIAEVWTDMRPLSLRKAMARSPEIAGPPHGDGPTQS